MSLSLAPLPAVIRSDETLPESVDVVVLGGGIVGASTALELAERGIRVALFERNEIGHEQSGRNLGWVRMTGRATGEIPLMARSIERWAGLNVRLGRETGYVRCGIVFADRTEKEARARRDWMDHPAAANYHPRPLEARELSSFFAGCSFPATSGLFSEFDGRAEPQLAAPAIAEGARDRGAQIFTQCAVRGFETAAGRVSAVVTERGIVRTSTLVVAGGTWSSLFLRRFGIDFPQLEVLGTVMRTEPLDGPDTSFGTGDFAFRRRLDGSYTVGSFRTRTEIVPDSFRYGPRFLNAANGQKVGYKVGGRFFRELFRSGRWPMDGQSPFELDRTREPVSWYDQQRVLDEVKSYFPFLREARLAQFWAGALDVTPDTLPVIDAVEATPGLHLASGFSGHGFGLGPGAGLLMSQIVTGDTPLVDNTAFSLKRFSRRETTAA
jgi:glycine/D-amino acid oxidase-like deaminating enzyme